MSEHALYRIQLSRHRTPAPVGYGTLRTKHYTLVKIMRDGSEVGRAYSDHHGDFAETVRRAKYAARKEAKFLRSLAETAETAHV